MNASVNNEKHGGKQAGKSTGIQAGRRSAEAARMSAGLTKSS